MLAMVPGLIENIQGKDLPTEVFIQKKVSAFGDFR